MMRLYSKIFSILILGGFILLRPAWADPEPALLNLDEAVKEALALNPEIHAMKQKVEAAHFKALQAGVWDDPQLGVEFEGMPKNTLDWGRYQDIEWSFSQNIPFPGKLSLKRKMAEQEVQKAHLEYLEKEREVTSLVKETYADFYLTGQSLKILKRHEELLKQFSQIAQKKYELGKGAQQDVLKAQVELAKMRNRILIETQEQSAVGARLNRLLARPYDTALGEPRALPLENFSWDDAQLMSLALENRSELKFYEFGIKSNEYGVKLARREYWPNFFTRLETRQFEGTGLQEYDVMLGINVPWLWTRSRVSNALKEARANLEEAKSEYSAKQLEIFLSIKENAIKVRTARNLVDLYRTDVLPVAEQAVQAAQVNYQTDKIDFLMLLDGQRSLLEFQLEYEEAARDYHKSRAELERSVGKEL